MAKAAWALAGHVAKAHDDAGGMKLAAQETATTQGAWEIVEMKAAPKEWAGTNGSLLPNMRYPSAGDIVLLRHHGGSSGKHLRLMSGGMYHRLLADVNRLYQFFLARE